MRNAQATRLPLILGTLLAAAAALAAPAPVKGRAGGVSWQVPARWTEQPARQMRVATYTVPAAAGSEAGECAVFYFGPGQGGSIDANVERWSRQFEGSPAAERTTRRVSGLEVTEVSLAGVYLAPGGPSMQSQGKKTGYRLLGAIVAGPEGNVFFKLTGPEATMKAGAADLRALLASLTR
jgi:hypothetical protein